MKIVLLRTPSFLSPIIRKIFAVSGNNTKKRNKTVQNRNKK